MNSAVNASAVQVIENASVKCDILYIYLKRFYQQIESTILSRSHLMTTFHAKGLFTIKFKTGLKVNDD